MDGKPKSEPLTFRDEGEREAWDRYAAGIAPCCFPNSMNMQNLEWAAEAADDLLRERRKRERQHPERAAAGASRATLASEIEWLAVGPDGILHAVPRSEPGPLAETLCRIPINKTRSHCVATPQAWDCCRICLPLVVPPVATPGCGGCIAWGGERMVEGRCPPGATCLACDRLGKHLEPCPTCTRPVSP